MNKALWLVALLASTIALAADSERVALEAAIQRWTTAVNAQDVDALNATMTEDVELLDDTTTVTGRDAAIRALREVATRGQLVATSREITIANHFAWRVGGLTQTQKNGDVHARGQTLEIWKRVKGKWKLHRQMAAGIIAPRSRCRDHHRANRCWIDRGIDFVPYPNFSARLLVAFPIVVVFDETLVAVSVPLPSRPVAATFDVGVRTSSLPQSQRIR